MARKGYFISIGAGLNQTPLIFAARNLGYSIISVDKNSNSEGFALSDLMIQESILDYRKIYTQLIQIFLDKPIQGIGCRSFGKANYTAAYISDKLNLIFPKQKVISPFLDKRALNQFLSSKGILTPRQINLHSPNEKKEFSKSSMTRYIRKPFDGESKKGIQVFNTIKEIENNLDFETKEYLVEEFIDGDEVTVLGFVQNKKFNLILLTDKITTSYSPFLERAHIYPSKFEVYSGEIHLICQLICNYTGLENSPFCAEFKITKDGRIYLIEAVPEIGGEYLAEALLPELKYNYFENYVRLMTNKEIELPKLNKQKSMIYFSAPPEGKSELIDLTELSPEQSEKIFFNRKDRKSTRLNSSHLDLSRMPSSA